MSSTKLYDKLKLLSPLVSKPELNNINSNEVRDRINEFLQNVSKSLNSDEFQTTISEINELKVKINTSGNRTTRGFLTLPQVKTEFNKIYDNYKLKYELLIQSGNFTNDITKIRPDYGEIQSDADAVLKEYNRYVIGRVNNNLPIPDQAIPRQILSNLPDGYINTLETYNSWIALKQNVPKGKSPFNFDVNKLLITALPQPKPVKEKVIPTGFTELGVNTFFKKLEGQLKNNYSDLMGDYMIDGADKPCKLFMDKNYNYVVVQGDKRQVFKDPIEARKFCLLGGFEADKVQKYRSSSLITNKLNTPFRVIPRTSV